MTLRGLFLADGPSDLPLALHLERLCQRMGREVDVVAVPSDRLPVGTGRSVGSRLRAVLTNDARFDCAFVHRDAEGQEPELRHEEVARGRTVAALAGPALAVVPVRMTEAWLLLDEPAIRRVAGRPSSPTSLDLPPAQLVEAVADPKAMLAAALVRAAGHRGRRLKTFRRQFGSHRRQLLEALDIDGPVRELTAWRRLLLDLEDLLSQL